MIECRIEIADVPVLIRCRYEENADFFRDYLTDKPERFVIEAAETDLMRMQEEYDRMDEAAGLPGYDRSDVFLENNAIHALLARRLLRENILLLHGSALCMDGQAYIFTAKSGTGKSTHTRLWRETFGDRVWMINDDKPFLKITPAGTTVYGTPWDGKHRLSRNASAPLRAIVKLERDAVNHLEPLARADAFPVLMRQAFISREPADMPKALELLGHLLGTAEFYALGCNMDLDAAKVAWEGMNAARL